MTEVAHKAMRFEVAGFSEQGPRPENQDAFFTDDFAESGLIALADGMGGEKSGRMAADTALQAVRSSAPIRNVHDARRAVREADRLVTQAAEADQERYGGMGAALALLALTDGGDGPAWIAAHVGDVRILSRSPDGVLRLETRDHTPAFARWEAGEITLDEIPDTVGANRLQRAVGRGGEADVTWLPAAPGWSWAIVSDGVYKAMRLDELSAAMAGETAATACETIRRKIEERGADDNFTAIVIRALGGMATLPQATGTYDSMTNDSRTVVSQGSSAGAGIALALAALALVVGGTALWTARETSVEAARIVEVEQLRIQVDSMQTILDGLVDPFGPAAPLPPPTTPNQQPVPPP